MFRPMAVKPAGFANRANVIVPAVVTVGGLPAVEVETVPSWAIEMLTASVGMVMLGLSK